MPVVIALFQVKKTPAKSPVNRVANSKMTVCILISKDVILLNVLFKYVINNIKFGVLALRDLPGSLKQKSRVNIHGFKCRL